MNSPNREPDNMTDLDLLAIAETWSLWGGRPAATTTPRRVALPQTLSDTRCLVVQGVRRCGKSTLMRQMVSRYGLDPERCLFVNFEDPRLSNALTWTTAERLVALFRARHGADGQLFFFLDEIQGVEGWQRWLRSQLDRPCGNVFVVTGSNASLLSGELATTLTGRHLTLELGPFDFDELRRHDPAATIQRYLRDGGFPEPWGQPDGDQLRRQYFHDIVERDVRERVGARSSRPLRQLVQMVYESAGSELSVRRVAAAVGIAVDTASAYLDACEAAYLLYRVPYFAYSERKRSAYNAKFYPVDTGLRRVVVSPRSDDRGKLLECATFLALRRAYGEVSYWRGRGGGEVDFVVEVDGEAVPIQVSWDGAKERHVRALDAFYEAFPRAREAVFVDADGFVNFVDGLDG